MLQIYKKYKRLVVVIVVVSIPYWMLGVIDEPGKFVIY